jgi:hypothetical protein
MPHNVEPTSSGVCLQSMIISCCSYGIQRCLNDSVGKVNDYGLANHTLIHKTKLMTVPLSSIQWASGELPFKLSLQSHHPPTAEIKNTWTSSSILLTPPWRDELTLYLCGAQRPIAVNTKPIYRNNWNLSFTNIKRTAVWCNHWK